MPCCPLWASESSGLLYTKIRPVVPDHSLHGQILCARYRYSSLCNGSTWCERCLHLKAAVDEEFLQPSFSFFLAFSCFTPFFLFTTFLESFLSINSSINRDFYPPLIKTLCRHLSRSAPLHKTPTVDHYLLINYLQYSSTCTLDFGRSG